MANRPASLIRISALLAMSFAAPSSLSAAPVAQPAVGTDSAPLERGQQISRAIATVTGTAISPLFGVCVLGAYTYAKTPAPERVSLPFYCSPVFWIPLAVLVVLILLKDTIGSAVPLLKKPLDAAEILVVNKAAFLFAVLPVMWHQAEAVSRWHPSVASLPAELFSTVHAAAPNTPAAAGAAIPMVLAVIAGGIVALAVWLTGHALDVLALLSPIPLLDVFFKASRVAVFLAVGVLTALHSRAALIISLIVIGVSLLCFWWAFRLAVFGSVFAWDILRSRLFGMRRDPSLDGEVLGFTAYAIGGLRKRSFGALRIAPDGSLEFVHRPVGIGFRSAVRLQSPSKYEVGKGFIFPCVLAPETTGKNYRFQFRLLPRYTGFENEIRDLLKLGGVRDLRIPSELQTAWNWLHGTVARVKAA
jgi:hypothetical protein